MANILVPTARRNLVMNGQHIPAAMQGQLSAVLRNKSDIGEMTYALGGRDAKPSKPLMIVGPDDHTVLMVVGDGVAETSELQELAYAGLERAERTVKRTGRAFDFEAARANAGRPSAAKFDELYRDALQRRVAQHKANPVSDPARVPLRINPTNKTQFGPTQGCPDCAKGAR